MIVSHGRLQLNLKPRIRVADGSLMDISQSAARQIYRKIVLFKLPQISSQRKWRESYPIDHAMRDTKYQAFHFKITHRIVVCNKYLCNIRVKHDNTCSFCDAEDRIQHFFITCPIARDLWRSFRDWLETQTDFYLQANEKEMLFGVSRVTPHSRITNFLLKFFTYRQKLFHQGALDITHLLRELRLMLSLERYILNRENKPTKFRAWQRIYTALG